MRVAIVTAWYPSDKNPLAGVFIENQVKALSNHCSVYVVLLRWSLIPYEKESKIKNVTIIERGEFYFPNKSLRFLNRWASIYVKYFKKNHEKFKFDIVHCHDHFGAFVSDKIKDQTSLPYIATIHNSNILNDKLDAWKKTYLSRVLQNAAKVVSVGKELANVLTHSYHIKDVIVIPNYIDTKKFNINPKQKENDFRFLFVGGLEPHKGVIEMIKAFHLANIQNASLHLVGEGILKIEIKRFIEKNKLGEKILLYGPLPNHSLPEFYNSSNVYISVSEYETFGITVLEAMSCGVPILYSKSGGPDELVKDFVGVTIDDRTVDSIKDGMLEIRKKYQSFDPSKIRDFTVHKYGSEKVIGAILDLYNSIIQAQK